MAKKADKHLRTVIANKKFFSNTENLGKYHYSVINDFSSNFEMSDNTHDALRASKDKMSFVQKMPGIQIISYLFGKKKPKINWKNNQ